MRKFLVVGCGGSGAKTQAYMMDQLKALMRNIEPERTELPKCWQFVTIDVPLTPENGPSKLPNVPQAGAATSASDPHNATPPSTLGFPANLSTMVA